MAFRTTSTVLSLLSAAIDTLLPPRCIGTGEIVDTQGMVSPTFWNELTFIGNPLCATCGLPFPSPLPEGSLCAACLEEEPSFTQARSCVVYNEASRRAILKFKYGDHTSSVHTFVPWMERAGAALLEQADAVMPVPLHRRRLWERRFNQSALLAQELARRTGKTFLPDTLLRVRQTRPQKGLSRKERNDNVKNAFAVAPHRMHLIAGKSVLLVDDVHTSGATLNACATALRQAGTARVFVLTIARVTRDEVF